MRNEGFLDGWKVWLYAAAAIALGAWATPWAYNVGKALAEVTNGKQTNAVLDQLGAWCRAAGFGAFYRASLVSAAIVLFFPFLAWLRIGGGKHAATHGQPLQRNLLGWLQGVTGFFLAAGLFWLLGYALLQAGSFEWKALPTPFDQRFSKIVLWAFAVALVQEILFRGIALGIFLRTTKPARAMVLSALLFSLSHAFFHTQGLSVADPDSSGAGFEMLGLIIQKLKTPQVLLTSFAPLFALGLVLAFCRWRTASLWLPIGFHMGWLVADPLFRSRAVEVPRMDPIAQLLCGGSLHTGLIPFVALIFCGTLVYFLTPPHDEPADTPP